MRKEYRSRGRVVMLLLGSIQREGPVGVTRLTTVVNLTHTRLLEFLSEFERNGLVEPSSGVERTTWTITPRGSIALEELHRVDRAMRDFGLDF